MTQWRRAMAASALGLFFTGVGTCATLVYLPLVLLQQGVDDAPAWTGRIDWTFHVSAILLIPVWSNVVERIGGVRTLLAGNALMAAAYVAVAYQHSPWAFLVLYVMLGATSAYLPACPAIIVKSLPAAQIPRGLGLLQLVSVAALVVGPLLARSWTADRRYADVYLLAAAALVVAALLAPAVAGWSSERALAATQSHERGTWRDVLAIRGAAGVYLLFFTAFLSTFGSLAPTSLYVVELCHGHLGEAQAWVGLTAAAFSAGLILPLPWLPRLGGARATRSVKWVLAAGAVTTAALGFVADPAWLTVMRFGQGLALSAASPLAFDILQARVSHSIKARAIGLGQAVGRLGMGVGSASAGALATRTGLATYFVLDAGLIVLTLIVATRTDIEEGDPRGRPDRLQLR